jgi:hypothetical protein
LLAGGMGFWGGVGGVGWCGTAEMPVRDAADVVRLYSQSQDRRGLA